MPKSLTQILEDITHLTAETDVFPQLPAVDAFTPNFINPQQVERLKGLGEFTLGKVTTTAQLQNLNGTNVDWGKAVGDATLGDLKRNIQAAAMAGGQPEAATVGTIIGARIVAAQGAIDQGGLGAFVHGAQAAIGSQAIADRLKNVQNSFGGTGIPQVLADGTRPNGMVGPLTRGEHVAVGAEKLTALFDNPNPGNKRFLLKIRPPKNAQVLHNPKGGIPKLTFYQHYIVE